MHTPDSLGVLRNRISMIASQGTRPGRRGMGRRAKRRMVMESLEGRCVLAASPIISEFLAANSGGLLDSDGDSSDWIEVYNPTSGPVDLNGWHLTDNAGDLNAWTFPSVTLAPNDFLVVFASAKNRSIPGQQLHTNFKLSTAGEFLALTQPDGTIASQFAPQFPPQASNVSYGAQFNTQTFVTAGSAAKTSIPVDNSLGNAWLSPAFADGAWASTPVGVGFGVVEPGFNVDYYKSNIEVGDMNTALSVIANPGQQVFHVSERIPTINYLGNGGGGNYGNDAPFPTQSIGDDINDFVIKATSQITIPSAGNWSFGVNSDDGFRLTLSRNGINYVVEYPFQRGPADTIGTVNLPAAGDYDATLVMYERAGGASVELFAAPGSIANWNATDFDLVGDTLHGGLASSIVVPAGPNSPLRTDIAAMMSGVNATAYVRIPFTVSNPSSLDSLRLRMRYDDGFVAYLNGVEVARRNAPNTLAFNSAATVDLTSAQAQVTEDINLAGFLSVLQVGPNVLAIQGLNSSASDSSFLVAPQLIGSQLLASDPRYFALPTPGGPNSAPSLGIVPSVTASVPAGFYDTPFSVSLSSAVSDTTIRYTTDGSTPSPTNGTIYTGPIAIARTTPLRAIGYKNGYVSLPSITRSYVFLEDVIQQSANGQPPAGWPATWGSNTVDYGIDPDIIALEGATVVKNALKSIPSLSITTDLGNLFDPATGIYSNAYNDGSDWERPASIELLNPDASPGFQVNAGLRVRGGYSRSGDNPKHSFRLFFRGEYGDSTLDYPMFGTNTPSIKKLDLRTAQNYSWSFGGDPSNNFVAEVVNRYTQRDMGMPYTRSAWYHLYLDGQYWGLYQTQERAEAEFAASYFGGLASNYDVIKPEAGPYANVATDGNPDAWRRLWTAAIENLPNSNTPALASNDAYMKLQGKNVDGSDNPNYETLLDVDNLAVYMINILYSGNLDAPISWFLGNERVNNFFAVRDRTGRQGFKYFLHDSEHTFRDVNENRNGPFPAGNQFDYFNPQYLHQRLMANAEYRIRFADLVQSNLFYDGPLSVAKEQQRFTSEAAKIDSAIYAESARWGDAKRPTDPLRHADWVNAVNGVVGGYFPVRAPIVIDQFRRTTLDGTIPAPLFPSIDAPSFIVNGSLQHGGQVVPNSGLRFGAATGVVYYTIDGTDPRLVGGGINPTARLYDPQTSSANLIPTNSDWRYRDTGVDLGSSWRAPAFNDSGWAHGNAELGYGDGDEATVVSYGPDLNNKYITTYFRKSFSVASVDGITGLNLRLKRDDGAVIYINGVEAVRSNMPVGTITASTLAASTVGGSDESTFFDFRLDPGLLVQGTNVIAVEIHQSAGNSSDISFDAQLDMVVQRSPSIPLGLTPVSFKTRSRTDSGEWSALESASFSVPLVAASATNVAVTEIHYNPVAYTGPNATLAPYNDPQNFEFLELRNLSDDVVAMDGVSFGGITYTFPTSSTGPVTWLLPGQSIVVVKNQLAFAARYLTPNSPFLGIKIAPGDYGTSNLSNGGETIDVFGRDGSVIQSFTYDDTGPGWPSVTDGSGPSLTVIRTNKALYDSPTNWRASFVNHGTPGIEENDAPISISLSANTVSENAPGALIGTLTTDDPDDRDRQTYSIVAGLDGALFAIVDNQLHVGSIGLNFEASPSRKVTVRSTDSAGAFTSKTFTIAVQDTNDPPVPNIGGPYAPLEGTPMVLTGSATDEDVGQTHSFEWDLDYDGSIFTTDATGPTPTVLFGDNGTRTIALRVTDNGSPAQTATTTTSIVVGNLPPSLTVNQSSVSGYVLTSITNAGTWSDVATDNVTLTSSLGTIVKNGNGTWAWSMTPTSETVNQLVTIVGTDKDGGTTTVTFQMTAIAAPIAPTIAPTSAPKPYDGLAYSLTVSASGPGRPSDTQTTSTSGTIGNFVIQFYSGSDLTSNPTANASKNAGTYAFTVAYLGNIDFQPVALQSFTYTIGQRTLTAIASAVGKIYDGSTQAALTYSNITGFVGVETVTVGSATGTFSQADVGNGLSVLANPPVLQNGSNGGLASNYGLATPIGLIANILPAPLSVVATPIAKSIGDVDPTLSFTASGFVPNENSGNALQGSLGRDPGESVGIYPIRLGSLNAIKGNYTIAFTTNNLTILDKVKIATPVINGGAAQRSLLTSIVVTFNAPVTLSADPFSIKNIGLTSVQNIPLSQSQIIVSPPIGAASRTFTITFGAGPGVETRTNGGNSLANGNYVLTIDPNKVTDSLNRHLTGANTFGNVATDNFFRLYGDIDGNGAVDSIDYAAAKIAFKPGNYNALFDIDGNLALDAYESSTFVASVGKRRRTNF